MSTKIKSKYFKLRIDRRTFSLLLLTITIYFIWFFAFPLFGPIINSYFNGFQALSIEKGKWVMFFLATLTLSNLITGYIIDKSKNRLTFILFSVILTSILTFTSIFLNFNDIFLISLLLGLAAGISPPAFGAYFADKTTPEERGRIMGISLAIMMPIAQLFLILDPISILAPASNKLVIIGSLILITLIIFLFKSDEQEKTTQKKPKGPKQKQIALYAIPIFLFQLVSGILLSIVFPTIQNQVEGTLFYLLWSIPFLLGAIFAGINLDLRGRKFPTIIGLAITGISLAIFAVLQINLGYILLIPLAFGYSFLLLSSIVIWSDLAPINSRGKFYGFGFGLIATAQMVGLILTGTNFGIASSTQINSFMLFSSVALFLSIPPLILADEALPRSLIEKRQLLDYLDGVKDKFSRKK